MKRFAVVLALLFFPLVLPAQEVVLAQLVWRIEPDCEIWATTSLPDEMVLRFDAVGFAGTPEWFLEFAHQTHALSCPHFTRSWGISGDTLTIRPLVNTSLHRAFRVRASWGCTVLGDPSCTTREWVFEVPELDFCLDAPEAPVCGS